MSKRVVAEEDPNKSSSKPHLLQRERRRALEKALTRDTRANIKEMSTNVTYDGKATDQPLTEGANAHGTGEGKYQRCAGPHDVVRVAKGHSILTCPLGHRCFQNDYIDQMERLERRFMDEMDRDCPDVDAIDDLAERIERCVQHINRYYPAHQERWAYIDREVAHAKNVEKLHKGSWAFTLTYSPAKHGWDKEEAQGVMREAIRRLRHYYRNEIVEFEAIGEWTQAGLPHVHGHYLLNGGKRITTKNFKRAYPIWNPNHRMGKGHEGGYHEPAKSDADYTGYIGKDLDEAWLVETYPNGSIEANLPEAHDPASDDHPSDDTSSHPSHPPG